MFVRVQVQQSPCGFWNDGAHVCVTCVCWCVLQSGRSVLDWQSLQTVSEDGGYTWSAPAVQNFTGGVQGVGPFHACQVMQGVNNSQTILAASRSVGAHTSGRHKSPNTPLPAMLCSALLSCTG